MVDTAHFQEVKQLAVGEKGHDGAAYTDACGGVKPPDETRQDGRWQELNQEGDREPDDVGTELAYLGTKPLSKDQLEVLHCGRLDEVREVEAGDGFPRIGRSSGKKNGVHDGEERVQNPPPCYRNRLVCVVPGDAANILLQAPKPPDFLEELMVTASLGRKEEGLPLQAGDLPAATADEAAQHVGLREQRGGLVIQIQEADLVPAG